MTLLDWLNTLGPKQIQRLKEAIGFSNTSAGVGAEFVAALTEATKMLTATGWAQWLSGIIPNATPFNPGGTEPTDPGPPPDQYTPPGWTWWWDGTKWTLVEEGSKPDDGTPQEPSPEEPPGEDGPTDEEIAGENAYEGWVAWMKDHGLFSAETDALAKQLITEGRDIDWFKRALRETQTYKTAFPEWDMREQAGLLPISEGDILRLRSQYASLTKAYYGVEPTKQQLANLIGASDKSIDEFEHSLQVYQRVQEYGGVTKQLFETILGHNLSDDDLMELFDPEIATPELNKAYDYARYQGLPTLLGFNARSTEEADLLKNAGLTPDEAFQKWQQAGSLSPVMQKLGAIDANVTGNEFLNDVPLETLAKGLVFDFTEEGKQARAEIQRTFAREFARFKKGGGAATDQSGRAVGLVTADQR